MTDDQDPWAPAEPVAPHTRALRDHQAVAAVKVEGGKANDVAAAMLAIEKLYPGARVRCDHEGWWTVLRPET